MVTTTPQTVPQMFSYIENFVECELSTGRSGAPDDMDRPLLDVEDTSRSSSYQKHSCRYQQPGFGQNHLDENTKEARCKIIPATSLCFMFMIIEFLGGYFAGSLAIMTDAAHLMSDCISFVIGLISISISKKPADKRMSFGYKRIEVLGAMLSIIGIWFLTALLFYLAIDRIITNEFDIDANTMMIISGIGIAINIIMAFTLHGQFGFSSHSHSHLHSHSLPPTAKHGYDNANKINSNNQNNEESQIPTIIVKRELNGEIRPRAASLTNREGYRKLDNNNQSVDSAVQGDLCYEVPYMEVDCHTKETKQTSFSEKNLNLRAAVIHVFGDLIQSVGVFIASIVIKFQPSAKLADPICTILFSVIVMLTTIKIMKESILVIMDAVPLSVSYTKVESDLIAIEGVRSVHHLNIWSHSVNHHLLMAHLTIDDVTDCNVILKSACFITQRKHNIKHSTFQIERQHEARTNE